MTTSAQIPPVAAAPARNAPTRRALLAGALGGLAAWAASAIGHAVPVRAGVDGDIVLGAANFASTTTSISNSTTASTAFQAQNTSSGIGIYGYGAVGVSGNSDSGYGVIGNSTTGTAIRGNGDASVAVFGSSGATNQPATVGRSYGNSTGVQGYSGISSLPAAKAKTGVYGYAAQDKYSRGVTGESPAGIGVYGISSTGYGVYSAGVVYTTRFYELTEIATPATPIANRARLFIKDDTHGKTQVCVKFANGTVKVLATEG